MSAAALLTASLPGRRSVQQSLERDDCSVERLRDSGHWLVDLVLAPGGNEPNGRGSLIGPRVSNNPLNRFIELAHSYGRVRINTIGEIGRYLAIDTRLEEYSGYRGANSQLEEPSNYIDSSIAPLASCKEEILYFGY